MDINILLSTKSDFIYLFIIFIIYCSRLFIIFIIYCIRFGVNHSNECNDLVVKDATFSWTDCLSYLGNTLISAKRFSVDLKPVRMKFYRSFNAIYGKIFKANEFPIVSLMKTFCISLPYIV